MGENIIECFVYVRGRGIKIMKKWRCSLCMTPNIGFQIKSAKSCKNENLKKDNIEQKGISWAGLAGRCLASR